MATFFGEVILPSSRAFFDDRDDSDSENDGCETSKIRETLEVNLMDNGSLDSTYNFFILSDGPIARDFVANYLIGENKVIAEFNIQIDQELHDETEMIYSKKLSRKPVLVATLYKTGPATLYLETSKHLTLLKANQLLLQIQQWLEKCKQIVVFASRPLSDYKCDRCETMPQTFVRSLATSTCSLPAHCYQMEQPNFISGIAASVLSWCELKKMDCLLHVCYTDALFSDSVILTPFLKCISESSLKHLVQDVPSTLLKHNNPVHLNVMYQ